MFYCFVFEAVFALFLLRTPSDFTLVRQCRNSQINNFKFLTLLDLLKFAEN